MPKVKGEKTEWVRSLWLLAAAIVIAIALFLHSTTPVLKVGNKSISLIVAKTQAEQQKGLGGRSSLPLNQGMLFVFDSPSVHCFWMKDMQFPLDIIWLNKDKQVVHIEANLSPKTYPKLYCPKEQAQYVIELNANEAKNNSILNNQKLNF